MQSTDEVVQMNWELPYFTNLAEDKVINTWHLLFDVGGGTLPGPTNFADAADQFKIFYDSVYAALNRALWVGATATMKFYELWTPPPHIPVYTTTRAIAGTAAAGNVPTESAVCFSYRATYIGGVPQARQRGRIFLGGFANVCANGSASSFPEIAAASRNALAAAGPVLKANLLLRNWTWVVFSPTQHAAGGQETFDVDHGWVDNTPDTQRRRGVVATARSIW